MTIYTCKGKGGRYEFISFSKGAGKSKGERCVVYQDLDSGEKYHRTLEDFNERMEEIDTEDE